MVHLGATVLPKYIVCVYYPITNTTAYVTNAILSCYIKVGSSQFLHVSIGTILSHMDSQAH